MATMSRDASVATAKTSDPKHFMYTSGETDPVWIHHLPYKNIPKFPKLDKDLETDVCIVGAGISGVSVAYELVTRGLNVVLIEGREVLSGETGRTSGHTRRSRRSTETRAQKLLQNRILGR